MITNQILYQFILFDRFKKNDNISCQKKKTLSRNPKFPFWDNHSKIDFWQEESNCKSQGKGQSTMASRRTLRSESRQTTPEYNVNKISKNNSRTFKVSTRTIKPAQKKTSNERFSPLAPTLQLFQEMTRGKIKKVNLSRW